MTKVTVRLLKPLNGGEIGSAAQYDQKDIARLVALGAVEVDEDQAPAKAKPAAKGKAERQPKNKMEPAPLNKSEPATTTPVVAGAAPSEGNQQG